ncbi:cardiolipin synthase, partial [Francisella tularensis subsp. holarctica]|nr:cardiolipin synthase [Francisella tularensis subsp. holarctica]
MSIEPEPISNTSLSESEHKGLPINVIKTFINIELPTLTQKNTFEIYTNGTHSYKAFIQAIESAKQ